MKLNTFSEFISNNTHNFRELLSNKSRHIFRVHITGTLKELLPNNITPFSRHETILAFSGTYWQKNNAHFSRAYTKQWHFQRVTGNWHFSKFHIIIKQHWHFQGDYQKADRVGGLKWEKIEIIFLFKIHIYYFLNREFSSLTCKKITQSNVPIQPI